jgi:hypothetical protein
MGENGKQTNKILGEATVAMHQGKKPAAMLPLDFKGGTPNQKAELRSALVRFHHFFEPNAELARQAVKGAIQFFQGMKITGHQCVAKTDEALTPSHGPIWWRAIMSLRATTAELVGRGGELKKLHDLVLEFLEGWTSLHSLGEVPSGPRRGEVVLPGSRHAGQGDQVTDVCHQLITRGEVLSSTGPKFFDLKFQDTAGAALCRQLLQSGVGFGPNVKSGRLPFLRSRLVVERFEDGHVARFPDGMPFALKPVTLAWVRYSDGERGFDVDPPQFAGPARGSEVRPVET